MKKRVIAMMVMLLAAMPSEAAVLVSRAEPQQQFASDLMAVHRLSNLEDYLEWVSTHVRYQKDSLRDTWASPQATIERGVGDCEDLAFLHEAMLVRFGHTSMAVSVHGASVNHAICIFVKDGVFHWIDNFDIHTSSATTFQRFLLVLLKHYKGSQIYELDRQTVSSRILFQG